MLQRLIAGCLLAIGLAACGMPDHPIRPVSSERYLAMTAAERDAEDQRVANADAALTRQRDVQYAAGIPVRVGSAQGGITMQWLRSRGLVQISTDGNPDGWNLATTVGMFLTLADDRGNPVLNRLPDGRLAPIPLLANVANQEGMERVVFRGVMGVFAGLANGAGGAAINAAFPCGNCRGTGNVNVNEIITSSGSIADARVSGQHETTVRVGGRH